MKHSKIIMKKTDMKVAITTSSFGKFDDQPHQLLKDSGLEIVLNPHRRKLSRDEGVELAADAVGLIAGIVPLDKTVLEKTAIT